MATYLYASTISKLPPTDFSITAESGGLTTQGYNYTYYVSVLCRGGKNLDSDGVAIALTAGQRLKVTFNNSIRKEVSEEFKILLSASSTGNAEDAKILAYWDAKDSQEDDESLPTAYYLSVNSQFLLGGEVASSPNLPSSNQVKGMVRYVVDVSQYKQWDGTEWVEVNGWSTYLTSTTQARTGTLIYGGCDRAINSIPDTEVIAPPLYEGGISTPVRLWLMNGLVEGSGTDIQAGELVDLLVQVNGDPLDAIALSGSIFVEVGQTLRKLDGTGDGNDLTGTQLIWYYGNNQFLFRLPMSLPRGYGLELIVSLSSDRLADGDTVSISPIIKGRYGDKDTSAKFLGSTIFSGGDRLRVIPSLSGLKRLTGSAIIATINGNGTIIDGYSFNDPDSEDLIGLVADAADQKIVISGSLGGYTSIYQAGQAIPKDRAIRAIASTESGTATPSAWSNTIQLTSNQILSLTIAHPCDDDGIGIIRENYPDVIAGMEAEFSADFYIYLEEGGNILKRSPLQTTNFQSTQLLSIDSLTGWTTVGSLPVSPSSDFCPWGYEGLSLSAVAGTGDLTTDTDIRVCIAYHYPSPNTRVTSISHDPNNGCTPELGISLIEAVERSQYSGLINANDPIRGYLEDKLVSSDEITIEITESTLSAYPKYWRSPVDLLTDLDEIEDPEDGEIRLCREDSTPYWWDGEGWTAIAGTGDGGGGSMSATDIRDALATLTGANRLSSDSSKEGSTNLFLTTGERIKLTNTPGDTNAQLALKATTTALNALESELETAIAGKLSFPATAPTQNGMALTIDADYSTHAVNLSIVGTTLTTVGFTQPAINGSPQIISVQNGLIFIIGEYVFMSVGGLYEVTARSSNTLTLINRNAESWPRYAGLNVESGQLIVHSGRSGANGVSAIAYTLESFNIPALNATEEIVLTSSDPFMVGDNVKIDAAGTLEVTAIDSENATITVKNVGNPDVGTVGSAIAIGSKVRPSGLRGATGSVESTTALELEQQSGDVADVEDKTIIFAKTDDKLYTRSPSQSAKKIITTDEVPNPGTATGRFLKDNYTWDNAPSAPTASQIRDSLGTLMGSDRLSSDSIKEGSTNKFITTAEESKIANLPADTNAALADKADDEHIHAIADVTGLQTALDGIPDTFLELTDTPNSYSGQALKTVRVKSDETGFEFTTVSGGGGGSGHTIQDEGSSLTARSNLNFIGTNVAVTDDAANDATKVTITGSSVTIDDLLTWSDIYFYF